MRLLVAAAARALALAALAFLGALALEESPPTAADCLRRQAACRTGCFDRHAGRDQAGHARCRDRCDRAWAGCAAGAPGG